jgi:reactive intermediate/imine deaminase
VNGVERTTVDDDLLGGVDAVLSRRLRRWAWRSSTSEGDRPGLKNAFPPLRRRFIPVGLDRRDMKRTISTDEAPAAVGAYSQATTDGSLVFTAGQIPLTTDGEVKADADVAEQTELALDNLLAVLGAAGATADDVLKTTVYLDDIGNFEAMNEAYGAYFEDAQPARSAVGVADLPKGVAVEVEAVATVDDDGDGE